MRAASTAPSRTIGPGTLITREGDTIYEGRLVNRDKGEYKGYPIEPEELPPGILP